MVSATVASSAKYGYDQIDSHPRPQLPRRLGVSSYTLAGAGKYAHFGKYLGDGEAFRHQGNSSHTTIYGGLLYPLSLVIINACQLPHPLGTQEKALVEASFRNLLEKFRNAV